MASSLTRVAGSLIRVQHGNQILKVSRVQSHERRGVGMVVLQTSFPITFSRLLANQLSYTILVSFGI